MATGLPWQKQKPALWAALERHPCRAETSGARVTVRFIKCSPTTSDYTGLVGANEALLDQLVGCGAIPDDSPKEIGRPIFGQLKVATRKEIGTYLEIEFGLNEGLRTNP